MPQIWPMNWVFLFVLFTASFIAFLSHTYFFNPNYETVPSKTETSVSTINLDWKW